MRNEKSYRGWTIIIEKRFVPTGRSYQTFWECRAYKGPADTEMEDVEIEAEMIAPARSFDKVIAYWEACARIDRIMGVQGTESSQAPDDKPTKQSTQLVQSTKARA